jgi:hypothetical protein
LGRTSGRATENVRRGVLRQHRQHRLHD